MSLLYPMEHPFILMPSPFSNTTRTGKAGYKQYGARVLLAASFGTTGALLKRESQ